MGTYVNAIVKYQYSGPSTVRPLYWTAAPSYVAKNALQNGWPLGRGTTVQRQFRDSMGEGKGVGFIVWGLSQHFPPNFTFIAALIIGSLHSPTHL